MHKDQQEASRRQTISQASFASLFSIGVKMVTMLLKYQPEFLQDKCQQLGSPMI
jgi:hypothetical protein